MKNSTLTTSFLPQVLYLLVINAAVVLLMAELTPGCSFDGI